jgi:hypothetical protein
MKITYLLILFLATGTYVHAQTGQESQVAIRLDALTEAMLHPDRKTLDDLMSGDVSYGHYSGLVQDKAGLINGMTNGPFHFLTIDISHQIIKITNDIAIVRQVLSTDYSNNGEKGTYKFGVLLVWHLEKGYWKLLARQTIIL